MQKIRTLNPNMAFEPSEGDGCMERREEGSKNITKKKEDKSVRGELEGGYLRWNDSFLSNTDCTPNKPGSSSIFTSITRPIKETHLININAIEQIANPLLIVLITT